MAGFLAAFAETEKEQWEQEGRKLVVKAGRSVLVLVSALLASFVVMGLFFGLKSLTQYDIYSFFIRFIIPLGAILGGFAAGFLLFVCSHFIGYRPAPRLVFALPLVAIAAHLFYLFLDYATTRYDGIALRQVISFSEYMKLYAASWKMGRAGANSTIAEGTILQGLQVAGFAGAQMLLYSSNSSSDYCPQCDGLISKKLERVRYSTVIERAQEIADEVAQDIEEGRLQNAVRRFPDFGTAEESPKALLRAKQTVTTCPKCGHSTVVLRLAERSGELWKNLDDYEVKNSTDEPLDR